MLQRETKFVPGYDSEALGFLCNVKTITRLSIGKKNNIVEWTKPQEHQGSNPTRESGRRRLGVGSLTTLSEQIHHKPAGNSEMGMRKRYEVNSHF